MQSRTMAFTKGCRGWWLFEVRHEGPLRLDLDPWRLSEAHPEGLESSAPQGPQPPAFAPAPRRETRAYCRQHHNGGAHMNDNRTARAGRPALFVAAHLPMKPNPCFCGSDDAFVDWEDEGAPGVRFFVWCNHCGASGPELPTYDLALAGWNRATQATRHGE